MTQEIDIKDKVSIKNVVGCGELPVEVDESQLARGLEEELSYTHFESKEEMKDSSEEEKQGGYTWIDNGDQPGLYYEVDNDGGPQVTYHKSGSYIVRASDKDNLVKTSRQVIEELAEVGIIDSVLSNEELGFDIENVVALVELGRDIDLGVLQMALNTESRYEPEIFPAIYTTSVNYPVKFLIYNNGKIITAGADSVEQAKNSVERFYSEIDDVYFSLTR